MRVMCAAEKRAQVCEEFQFRSGNTVEIRMDSSFDARFAGERYITKTKI